MEAKKNTKEKLSLKRTIANAFYALGLSWKYSKSLVIHTFLLYVTGYFEWIFFDGYFMKRIVGGLSENEGFKSILGFVIMSAIVLGIIAIYVQYAKQVVTPLESNRLYGGIYKLIYTKARNVELRCYEDSDFYNRFTMAIDKCDEKINAVIGGLMGAAVGLVSTVIVFTMMYEIDHYSILFILSPLIGSFVFGNLKRQFEYKRYQEQVPNNKVLNYVSRMMYLPDGAKEIRLSNVFNLFRRQYSVATDNNVKAAKKYAFKNAFMNFWSITFTFTVIFEGVMIYAVYRTLVSGTISLAELTIMTSLMVAATWILIRLFEDILGVIQNGLFVNNLRGFLDYKEQIPEDQDGIVPDMEFASLEFRNVSFSYQDEETIKDLSFKISKGEIAALVGHNGAGKTTIVKLMLRLYDPTEGTILYNNIDVREYNLKAYRDVFATTFQDFQLFGMTIKENVLMGRHYTDKDGNNADDEQVVKALKRAGVYDKVMTLSEGIDSMMTKEFDEDGVVLSGGESQKVAVARTFIKDAPMKIFDEPSSALDPIAEFELFRSIMKEGRSHTMMFISHRLSSVKGCDKVFMLEKGRLIEEGSHSELMALNGSYAQMYKKQAMNYLAIENEEEVVL